MDAQGELWVGVWGEGVYHFKDDVWTKYDPSNSPLLSIYLYVKEIENNGTVWLWGESYGLVEFQQQTNTWNVYLKNQTIHSVHKDLNGNLWAQSPTALFKKQGNNFLPIKEINSDMSGFNNLHLLNSDPEGRLIVGTNTGFLTKTLQDDWIDYNPPGLWDSHINDLIIDDRNTKWIATRAGLHKITADKKTSHYDETNSDLPSSYINGLATAKDGKLWIATNAGLVTYDGKKWKILNTENSDLMSDVINDVNITEDETVWVSFSNYAPGVQRFDGKKWQHFTTEQGLTSNSIKEIHIIKNEVWLQSSQGISIFNNNQWHMLTVDDGLLSNNITSMALMKKHAWIGTDKGLIKYDGKKFDYIVEELPALYVGAIYEDPQSNLFIGLRDVGLSVLNKNNQWEHKDWDDGLTHARISHIVPDASQQLWLGTEFAIGITQLP